MVCSIVGIVKSRGWVEVGGRLRAPAALPLEKEPRSRSVRSGLGGREFLSLSRVDSRSSGPWPGHCTDWATV